MSRAVGAKGSSAVLTEAMEHACPDGHAGALEGHHPPQIADGLMLEEEEEGMEFKETSSEVNVLFLHRL